jgi:hypothetical protein
MRERRLLHTLKHVVNCLDAINRGDMGINDITRKAVDEGLAEIRMAERYNSAQPEGRSDEG